LKRLFAFHITASNPVGDAANFLPMGNYAQAKQHATIRDG